MDYFRSKRYLQTLEDWETGTATSAPLSHYLPRMRALLTRLDNPQCRYPSVIVGGTNGKGSVASLLAALLKAAGKRVGLYTSPHLHTLRERIQVDGAILEKEQWAEAVSALYDRTRRFEQEGHGDFTRFEALTGLAAWMFSLSEVDYAVFEVGLGGRYDATNAWDHVASVLTSIQLDHVEVLGTTLAAIAEDKSHIARPGRPLFTSETQHEEVRRLLDHRCRDQGIPICWVSVEGVALPERIDLATPIELPATVPDRPATYLDNARLAVAAAQHLLGDSLSGPTACSVVESHTWPGRFEIVGSSPPLILDGAHNPAAAEALVGELRKRSEGWRFVVGTSDGHDAADILQAIAPIATDIVLTRSTHPRAADIQTLQACVPTELAARCRVAHALKAEDLVADGPLCVTGSLHLVARVRELLGLPLERDTFTEDLHRESLLCLTEACHQVGLKVVPVSGNGNVVRLDPTGSPTYFLRNKHPFNDYVTARLAEDKAYQHELFTQAGLVVPGTLQVFNPLADARFGEYKTHTSVDDVISDAESRFEYPVVVKRNQGSLAQGVFLAPDREELRRRLGELFEGSGFFDNILLVQAFIKGPEYRSVATQDEMLLAYQKVADDVEGEDLNPLHQTGSEAVKVTDTHLLTELSRVTEAVASVLDLGFYAVDLIDGEGGLHILEVNPNPICYFYNQCNGRDDFVRVYRRLLEKYVPVA